jgi:hypothetical protein
MIAVAALVSRGKAMDGKGVADREHGRETVWPILSTCTMSIVVAFVANRTETRR